MGTTTDLGLIDTNVLVHSFYDEQPQYPAAVRLRDSAHEDDAALCIAPQTIAEFYAVVTNSRRVSVPFTAAEALAEIDKLLAQPGLALLSTLRCTPLPSFLNGDVGHRVMLEILSHDLSASLLGYGCKYGVIHANSVAGVPPSVQGSGTIDDGLGNGLGSNSRQKREGLDFFLGAHEKHDLRPLHGTGPQLCVRFPCQAPEQRGGLSFPSEVPDEDVAVDVNAHLGLVAARLRACDQIGRPVHNGQPL
jgi:predicted nucleic acid-binding protein